MLRVCCVVLDVTTGRPFVLRDLFLSPYRFEALATLFSLSELFPNPSSTAVDPFTTPHLMTQKPPPLLSPPPKRSQPILSAALPRQESMLSLPLALRRLIFSTV